ncbi:SCO3242 family prenyltransferase [Streptomyces sp. MAI_2237]
MSLAPERPTARPRPRPVAALSRPTAPTADAPRPAGRPLPLPAAKTVRAWAELLRLPAVCTAPGDVLAGTAVAGARPGRATLCAAGASVCLYAAGMALNDWADEDEDARDRPHRPLPSGRIRPRAALAAAGLLSAAGLALAAGAGRRSAAVAVPLAAVVWAYDLKLKNTPAAPAAMAAARGLDLLLGAASTGRPLRPALIPAALLAQHTGAVTLVSRTETQGGSPAAPLAALAATAAVTATLIRTPAPPGPHPGRPAGAGRGADAVRAALIAAYPATVAAPLLHTVLNPSPPLTQRAVGAGIRGMVCVQGALAARAGAPGTALLTAALAPLAARLARKVSPT